MKCLQHPRTGIASRVKEKLRVLWDVVGKDWNKRNIPGCAGMDGEMEQGALGSAGSLAGREERKDVA